MAAVLLADMLRHFLSRLASCGGSRKEAGCMTPQQQAALGLLCETLINSMAAKASLNTAALLTLAACFPSHGLMASHVEQRENPGLGVQADHGNKAGKVKGQQIALRGDATTDKVMQNVREMATQTGTCEAASQSESAFLQTLRTELHEANSLLSQRLALPIHRASP